MASQIPYPRSATEAFTIFTNREGCGLFLHDRRTAAAQEILIYNIDEAGDGENRERENRQGLSPTIVILPCDLCSSRQDDDSGDLHDGVSTPALSSFKTHLLFQIRAPFLSRRLAIGY
ncbi:hypothetical protein KSP39_PZI013083 [Platanthera zijinensis]|uniref:Uncharacterized protein n=1 Tax=Platanthera zijinensis TaxID=2320716 RepID=A0AAP0G396_9ASPA